MLCVCVCVWVMASGLRGKINDANRECRSELNNSDGPRPYCYSVKYVRELVLRGLFGRGQRNGGVLIKQ